MIRVSWTVGIALVISLAAFGCGSDNDETNPSTTNAGTGGTGGFRSADGGTDSGADSGSRPHLDAGVIIKRDGGAGGAGDGGLFEEDGGIIRLDAGYMGPHFDAGPGPHKNP